MRRKFPWYRCDTGETGTGAVLCAVTKGVSPSKLSFTAADIGKIYQGSHHSQAFWRFGGTAKEVMTSFPVTEGRSG